MAASKMPVLVGCGQFVQKEKNPEKAKSPLEMMADAARAAAADAGIGEKLWPVIDNITCVRMVVDSPEARDFPFGRYPNAPKSLANVLGADAAKCFYGPTGGNTPQYLVNHTAEQIAQGHSEIALLAGAECFGSMMRALGEGKMLPWNDDPGTEPLSIGTEREGVTRQEKRHKLHFPVNAYPLLENALRGEAGRSVAEQQMMIGKLMAPFSKVAAQHPCAWFPTERSAEEIATPGESNRIVGFPYTKYMNAVMQVDQSAAVLMMSVEKARELGVPEDKWVYLHGCADANELWYLTERQDFVSSPAIRTMRGKAFDMAGWSMDQVDYFDLYSCFPSLVQITCKEFGLAHDDPRGLTVTGGLPYFGGAGNNYVMHSIATMMEKLRAKPGSKGLVTSNGWYATKHGIGLYSTTPVEGAWEREAPASYQKDIDALPHPAVNETPNGRAKIETYTVVHDRNGPQMSIVMGRMEDDGSRFVAHTPDDPATLYHLMDHDALGRSGIVTPAPDDKGTNLFTPD